ncbi:MAG: PAS domain-containing protein [Sulfurovum sp.]|nr:MAG: PAS domain-containing protein [Sulfurovum sp.]
MIYRPIAINEEIKFSKTKFIVSRTDLNGNIVFINKNFSEISGYAQDELIGISHNVVRHPDMPKAVFYIVWNALKAGRPISGIVKNLTKDGRYYWVIVDFDVKKNSAGEIIGYSAFRRSPPQHVIDTFKEPYSIMLNIEKKHGMEASLTFLNSFLEEHHMSYDEFIQELIQPKGLIATLLASFKRMFS